MSVEIPKCVLCVVFYLTEAHSASEDIGSVTFRRSTCSKQNLANKKYFHFFFYFVRFFISFVFNFQFLRINHNLVEMLFKFVLLSGLLAICSAQRVIYDIFFNFILFACPGYTSNSQNLKITN